MAAKGKIYDMSEQDNCIELPTDNSGDTFNFNVNFNMPQRVFRSRYSASNRIKASEIDIGGEVAEAIPSTLSDVLAAGNAAGGSAITGLANPSGAQDAATKAYVDTQVAAVPDPTLSAVLAAGNSAGSERITTLADPTGAQDAATKAYVDTAVAGASTVAELNDLTDVDFSVTLPFDGSYLRYDGGSSKFVPNAIPSLSQAVVSRTLGGGGLATDATGPANENCVLRIFRVVDSFQVFGRVILDVTNWGSYIEVDLSPDATFGGSYSGTTDIIGTANISVAPGGAGVGFTANVQSVASTGKIRIFLDDPASTALDGNTIWATFTLVSQV